MIVNKISDLIVFQTLKNLRHGFLEITNFDGEVFKFGDVNMHVDSENYNFIEMSHHIILVSIVDIFAQKLV